MRKSSLFIYISLLFILFFDLWIENSEQAQKLFGNWIKPFIDETEFPLVWTILIVVGIVIFVKDMLATREKEKEQLEKVLGSEMEILIMANKELNYYRLQDNLVVLLNKFVERHAYISAAQWYRYGENNHQGQTKFKLNFQQGAVAEEVNLNAIQQLYYSCNSSFIREFRKVKRNYTEKGDPNLLVDFIINTYRKIDKKQEESLNKEDAVMCSLMLLAFEILERDFGLVFEDFLGSDGKFQKLIDSNRTGILQAAMMEDEFYSFTHTRDNEKFNRQYMARLVRVRDENIIFTIVMDSGILDEEKYDEIMQRIATDFERLLKELEIRYNKINQGAGDQYANR